MVLGREAKVAIFSGNAISDNCEFSSSNSFTDMKKIEFGHGIAEIMLDNIGGDLIIFSNFYIMHFLSPFHTPTLMKSISSLAEE